MISQHGLYFDSPNLQDSFNLAPFCGIHEKYAMWKFIVYVVHDFGSSPRSDGGWVRVFSCDQAALWMVFSVWLSVCLSVRLSHPFHYVPIIVLSWNFQELLPMTKVRSMQKVKVRGQMSMSQRSKPNLTPFPDYNSSLNSHMIMKWCTQLDVA